MLGTLSGRPADGRRTWFSFRNTAALDETRLFSRRRSFSCMKRAGSLICHTQSRLTFIVNKLRSRFTCKIARYSGRIERKEKCRRKYPRERNKFTRDNTFEISSAYRSTNIVNNRFLDNPYISISCAKRLNFLKFRFILKIQIYSVTYPSDKCVMCRQKCRRKWSLSITNHFYERYILRAHIYANTKLILF